MNIRCANLEDLGAWIRMRNDLWPDSRGSHEAELSDYFDGTSTDIAEAFLLDTDIGMVAGFIELNIRNFAEGSRAQYVPYIEAWYVSPEFRGRGYGVAMIRFAEQWALDKGFDELASDTTLDNLRSISLHKQLGFDETERAVCFLKKLANDGEGLESVPGLPQQATYNFLADYTDWHYQGGKLCRSYSFSNFIEAFAFMTRVALVAERDNHHPEWSNVYNKVEVRLVTHETGTVTAKDLKLARLMDSLADA